MLHKIKRKQPLQILPKVFNKFCFFLLGVLHTLQEVTFYSWPSLVEYGRWRKAENVVPEGETGQVRDKREVQREAVKYVLVQ